MAWNSDLDEAAGAADATACLRIGSCGGVEISWVTEKEVPVTQLRKKRFVDLDRHDCEEVGAGRQQRIKVGHHVFLPDEGIEPAALRVLSASHRMAFIVDAECDPV
jgi:hypothetical protein